MIINLLRTKNLIKHLSYSLFFLLFIKFENSRVGRRGVIFCHILPYQNVSFCYDKLVKIIGSTSENPDGAKRIRTADPLHAMQVLYQLSYGPKFRNVILIYQSKDFFHNVRNSYSTL